MKAATRWHLLTVALLVLLAACGRSEEVTVEAEGTSSSTTTASANGDGASSAVQIDQADLDANLFTPYLESSESQPEHPGRARFILVDEDGNYALDGPPRLPAFSFTVGVWAGVSEPVEMTLSYGNVRLDIDGQIVAGACRNVWGELDQPTPSTFSHDPNSLPQIQGAEFARDSQGCPPEVFEPEGIFDREFSIEFDDGGLTVVASDGTRWPFRHVDLDLTPVVERDPDFMVEMTTTTTTTPPPPADGVDPNFSPNGEWQIVSAVFNSENLLFGTEEQLYIFGRSVRFLSGTCEGAEGTLVWDVEGSVTLSWPENLTCPRESGDELTNLLSTVADWETISSGTHRNGLPSYQGLVLSGPGGRIEMFRHVDEPRYVPIDGSRELGDIEGPPSAPDGEDLPQLDIDGDTATLSSNVCTLSFDISTSNGRQNTPFATSGIDPSLCPDGTAAHPVATQLAQAEFAVATTSCGRSTLSIWDADGERVDFITPEADASPTEICAG